jgi:hypothetical protein
MDTTTNNFPLPRVGNEPHSRDEIGGMEHVPSSTPELLGPVNVARGQLKIDPASVEVATRTEVVGDNPEPDDEASRYLYADFLQVVATLTDGRQVALTASTVEDDGVVGAKLLLLARKVARRGSIVPAAWHHIRWEYGTPGWDNEALSEEIRGSYDAGDRGRYGPHPGEQHLLNNGLRTSL